MHEHPKIGLSEAAESIGKNKQRKQALTNIDTEEIIGELDGLQQLFYPLNSWNKTSVDKSYVKDICNRMADADLEVWDRIELLGKQMYICAIHHKNLWFSMDKPGQYATKLKVEDGSDKEFKQKPSKAGLVKYWAKQLGGRAGAPSETRTKMSSPKKRRMFESDTESSSDEPAPPRPSKKKKKEVQRTTFSCEEDSETPDPGEGSSGITASDLRQAEEERRVDTGNLTEDVSTERKNKKKRRRKNALLQRSVSEWRILEGCHQRFVLLGNQ